MKEYLAEAQGWRFPSRAEAAQFSLETVQNQDSKCILLQVLKRSLPTSIFIFFLPPTSPLGQIIYPLGPALGNPNPLNSPNSRESFHLFR